MPPMFDLKYQSEERANCEPWQWYSLDDFIKAGFDQSTAEAWLGADVSPAQAAEYVRLGMSPQDAWGWGMVPEAVRSFLEGGFDKEEAWEWANWAIFGYEAMFWRDGGYTPFQASVMRETTKPVAQAVLWALTGLCPQDAWEHANSRANPAAFLTRPKLLESPAPGSPEDDQYDMYDDDVKYEDEYPMYDDGVECVDYDDRI